MNPPAAEQSACPPDSPPTGFFDYNDDPDPPDASDHWGNMVPVASTPLKQQCFACSPCSMHADTPLKWYGVTEDTCQGDAMELEPPWLQSHLCDFCGQERRQREAYKERYGYRPSKWTKQTCYARLAEMTTTCGCTVAAVYVTDKDTDENVSCHLLLPIPPE